MARIFPPASSIARPFLPQSEGQWRAPLIRKKALGSYFLFFSLLFLTLANLDHRFPGILGFATDISTEDIVSLTNEERSKHNRSTLKLNSKLSLAAEAKARDMFAKNYWAHNSPDGLEPWDFIDDTGYRYFSAGENLAKDFNHSNSVVKAWMDSPSHRENLLSDAFSEIGVAVVNGELNNFETTLVVQMFGKPQAGYLAGIGAEEEPAQVSGENKSVAMEIRPKPTPRPIDLATARSVESALENSGYRPLLNTQAFAGMPSFREIRGKLDLRHFGLSVGFLCAIFLAGLFALDFVVVGRRRSAKVTLRTLTHLALLIFLLVGVWYLQVGTIL